MHHLRPRLNHATVVAYLALFVSAENAYAVSSVPKRRYKAVEIRRRNVAEDQERRRERGEARERRGYRSQGDGQRLTGAQINESTLFPVPSASHSANADQATNMILRERRSNDQRASTNADHATNADSLGGTSASTRPQDGCHPRGRPHEHVLLPAHSRTRSPAQRS